MSRIIAICALASILAVPAKALDGTPLPPNTAPTLKAAPLDLPPNLLAQAPNPALGVDPLIGTWKLNVEKSTGTASMIPKSWTLTWTGEGPNLIDTAEGVDAQGRTLHVVFKHIYDGVPHPTTGSPDWDSTTYTRIGNTINSVRFKQGKVVEVGQAVIVPGKTYTLSVEGIDANNQRYRTVTEYDRQ